MEIYDTAGQEDFKEIRTLVYPGTDVFIMCYSSILRQTLENITNFWLAETKGLKKNVPFVLVGNKLDLKDSVKDNSYVKPSEAEAVLNQHGGQFSYQCSAKNESLQGPQGGGVVQRLFKQAFIVGISARNEEVDDPTCACTLL